MSQRTNEPAAQPKLTGHAIKVLFNGKHAPIGGKSVAMRARNLIKIAAAYSRAELLEGPGTGMVTTTEIQLWLEEHGTHLRSHKKE